MLSILLFSSRYFFQRINIYIPINLEININFPEILCFLPYIKKYEAMLRGVRQNFQLDE